MADHITLNATIFGLGGSHKGPTNIEEEVLVFGTEFEADTGDLSMLETGKKRQWVLTWNDIPVATRTAIRAIALLSSTFTYIDEDGNSFTVQCPKQSRYKSGISIIANATTLYYGVTLTIRQA